MLEALVISNNRIESTLFMASGNGLRVTLADFEGAAPVTVTNPTTNPVKVDQVS